MASSQVHAHGDDTFSREFDTGDDDDALALLRPSSQPTMSSTKNIPKPPPLPLITYQRNQASRRKPSSLSRLVPKDAVETWDKLFKEGIGADTFVETDNKSQFSVHSSVLAAASPVMAKRLNQSLDRKRKTYLKILGVPCEAVYMFIRFLYSSCYEEEEMKKFVLHLLVLSHYYSVPSLKRVCVEVLEQGFINKENVIDVLQLSRNCDAARIFFLCFSMVIKDFKSVSSTEGWKVMKRSNPLLELELTEAVVESVTRKEERRRKAKDREMYLQLYEAMEALVHICSEGCATIGPRDKALKGSQAVCNFPACKRLEGALRHFLGCKSRASCLHCKRMWKLLQLHSCICDDSGSCEVPLCRNFKEKMKKLRKKQQSKWRLLVENIIKAKNSLGPFSSRPLNFKEKMKKLRTVSGRFLHVIWFDIRQVSVYSHKNFGFFMDSPVRCDEDVYDRIWISRTFSYYREINTSLPVLSDNNSYNLSSLVMSTAMAPTRPITMTLENSDPNVRYFVYMHFADVEDLSLTPNQAREFDISVNGVKVASSFRSKYLETNTFYLNPESQTDIGFSLVRTPKSTLPPIVNAGKEILVCLMTTFGRALIVIMIVSKLIENIVA